MPLFQDSKNYGGRQTLIFKQFDGFVETQRLKLLTQKRDQEAAIINNGVCASTSLNWLEFYADHPDGQYSADLFEQTDVTERIVESQIFLVNANTALYHFLPEFGPKEDKGVLNKNFNENQDSYDSFLKPGIVTISFQSMQKPENNHSAVIIVHETKENTIFNLS